MVTVSVGVTDILLFRLVRKGGDTEEFIGFVVLVVREINIDVIRQPFIAEKKETAATANSVRNICSVQCRECLFEQWKSIEESF